MLKKGLISAALVIAAALIVFYIFLPPINPHAVEFWLFLSFLIFVGFIPFFNCFLVKSRGRAKKSRIKLGDYVIDETGGKFKKFIPLVILLPILVVIIGGIFSSTVFFARQYASVIDVKESVFKDDLPETTEITNIALMDTESATKLGDKTLGALSNVVSQYDVSQTYTQINYKKSEAKRS